MRLKAGLQPWRRLLRWGAGFGIAVVLGAGPSWAKEPTQRPETVSLRQLPPEARAVDRAIHAGGSFASAKDGVVFANRERLLPARARDFYREYTVATPGVRDRGARRIVCGGWRPTAPETCYYTGDHYASFRRITP